MSQGFKLRYDQMWESNPTKEDGSIQPEGSNPFYLPSSHARNLCLTWLDGKKMFLNYAYLTVADFDPGEDLNSIRLMFSSHNVLIKGYGLAILFDQLMEQLPRTITVVDPRYHPLTEEVQVIVWEISVTTI